MYFSLIGQWTVHHFSKPTMCSALGLDERYKKSPSFLRVPDSSRGRIWGGQGEVIPETATGDWVYLKLSVGVSASGNPEILEIEGLFTQRIATRLL